MNIRRLIAIVRRLQCHADLYAFWSVLSYGILPPKRGFQRLRRAMEVRLEELSS